MTDRFSPELSNAVVSDREIVPVDQAVVLIRCRTLRSR
jgi:hypothetical protein